MTFETGKEKAIYRDHSKRLNVLKERFFDVIASLWCGATPIIRTGGGTPLAR